MEFNVCLHARLEARVQKNSDQHPLYLENVATCPLLSKELFVCLFLMQMMLHLALRAASVHEMEIQSTIQVLSKVTKFQRTIVKIRFLESNTS